MMRLRDYRFDQELPTPTEKYKKVRVLYYHYKTKPNIPYCYRNSRLSSYHFFNLPLTVGKRLSYLRQGGRIDYRVHCCGLSSKYILICSIGQSTAGGWRYLHFRDVLFSLKWISLCAVSWHLFTIYERRCPRLPCVQF